MDAPLHDPARVLAWVEAETRAGVDGPVAYAWQPDREVAVLGLAQEAARELHLDRLGSQGVALLRRASGGGAVLLTPGVLCFGALAPPGLLGGSLDVMAAFRALLAPMLTVLSAHGTEPALMGTSDLALRAGGSWRKVAGTAQLRKRSAVLVHGSLIVNADPARFGDVLRAPSKEPGYREGRGHDHFCTALSACGDGDPTPVSVAGAWREATARLGWSWCLPPRTLGEEATALLAEKYHHTPWNLDRERRT